MKLIRLDYRHKAKRLFQHEWAFQFANWFDARAIENVFKKMYGEQWVDGGDGRLWSGAHGAQYYFVSFKHEHDATIAMLQLDHTE